MPTNEQLSAEVAALRAELARVKSAGAVASPFIIEQTHKQTDTPPNKTAEVGRGFARSTRASTRQVTSSLTPEEILAQIIALKSVVVSGVDSAGYGDKRTEFRSLAELRQILADLEEDLDAAMGTGGRVRQIRMTIAADKGL